MADVSARALYGAARYGILSTHSADVPGYPFGSLVVFCPDENGDAILLLSGLAQHTANLQANSKASLMVVEEGNEDPQAKARLTVLGDVSPLGAEAVEAKRRYLERFPASFGEDMGFRFFRLRPVRARLIGGFGKISWIEPAELSGGAAS